MKKGMKRLWAGVIILLVILLAMIGILLWKNTEKQDEYNDQVALGDKYLAEMQYENAEICFREAIAINPKQAKPYIQLADVYIQTQRYEDALTVLDDAEKNIPSSETKKRDAIRKKRSQVESAMGGAKKDGETDPPGEAEVDAWETAKSVLGLPDLTEGVQWLQFEKSAQAGIKMTPLYETGIICADRYDYDMDGQDEILAAVLIGGSEASKENALYLYMMEQSGGSWSIVSQLLVNTYIGLMVYSVEVPARLELFTRESQGQVTIYAEDTGISQFFSDGEFWYLTPYQYRDGSLIQSGETVYTAGSDVEAYASMRMDASIISNSQEYVTAFISKVNAMGFSSQQLGWEYPLVDNPANADCRKLVRMIKDTQLTHNDTYSWQQSSDTSPLPGVSLSITDFSRTEQ